MKRTACKLFKIFFAVFCLTVMPWQAASSGDRIHATASNVPHSPKKSAPIDITYSLPAQNGAGEDIPVTVSIKTLADTSSLKLEITADSGLDMSFGTTYARDYGSLLRNAAVSESFTVVSKTDGRLYLNVFATGVFGGRAMTQVISIPVNIGTATNKQQTSDKSIQRTDSVTKQNIIVMPAEEKGQK